MGSLRLQSTAGEVVKDVPGANGTEPQFALAGSFLIQTATNDVQATVGGDAELKSGLNVQVNATMTQKTSDSTAAAISVPQGADQSDASLALTLQLFSPTVKATVDDNAHIDAFGAIDVLATLDYPFLVYNPFQNPLPILENPAGLAAYLLAALGGAQNFAFNDWTRTSATVAQQIYQGNYINGAGNQSGILLGIGGTIYVGEWTNVVEAVIGDAMINQSTAAAFRGTAADPNDGQSVSVAAQTTYDHIALDGNVTPFNLFGTSGARAGVGAAVRANIMNNTTIAQIDSGAMVDIGSAGTLNVEADQSLTDISLVPGRYVGRGHRLQRHGRLERHHQFHDRPDSGRRDRRRRWCRQRTGQRQCDPRQLGRRRPHGPGLGLWLHCGGQHAQPDDDRPNRRRQQPIRHGQLPGRLDHRFGRKHGGRRGGDLRGGGGGGEEPCSGPDAHPLEWPGRAQSVGCADPLPGAAGLGISGDVALNTVTDDTEASISDAGAFTMTGGAAVNASDQTIIASIAGAITARTAGSGGGVALAGSYGQNEIVSTTVAYVNGATISGTGLDVEADDGGFIGNFTAGGAGAPATASVGGIAVGRLGLGQPDPARDRGLCFGRQPDPGWQRHDQGRGRIRDLGDRRQRRLRGLGRLRYRDRRQ